MAISRAQMLKELVPGLHALFGMDYDRYENEHKAFFEANNSERAFEEEVLLAGFGQAPTKTEGGSITYDEAAEVWTARYTHETIALGFSITEEAIEDNLYDTLSRRYTKALARSMAYTKQVKAANVLNNAFTSGYIGGDGVILVSTSHPTQAAGTLANRPTTLADLSETALESAYIDIAAFKDDRGLLMAAKAKRLIIPQAQEFVAKRILGSDNRVGTADNDINALKSMGAIPGGYFVSHYLTSTTTWFLTTDVPDGLKMFVRVPIQTKNEGDFDSGNMRFKARERYSFGWSDWRGIYGGQS